MGCFPSNRSRPRDTGTLVQGVVEPQPLHGHRGSEETQLGLLVAGRLVLKSKFTKEDVSVVERTPDNSSRHLHKYSCPVCMRFFSTILVSECCRHYICHACVDEMQRVASHQDLRCPMCQATPLALSDVDQAAAVKRYSDSPYSTLGKASQPHGGKWLSPLAIVEEDQRLGCYEHEEEVIAMSERFLGQLVAVGDPARTH